jgi:hypothetical protein
MAPHEAAQSAAWFAVLMFVWVGVILFLDFRREVKEKGVVNRYET